MDKVVIVGVGALGSHVALLLRNLSVILIDDDRIETQNTLSQFHTSSHIGRNKAMSLVMTIGSLFRASGKRTPIPHRLVNENSSILLDGASLVIDCTDNGAARRVIQSACHKHDLPCLHGALSADGTFGRAVWMEHFRVDDEPGDGAPTCEDGENLPFHGLAGAHIACIAQRFLKTRQRVSIQFTAATVTRLA